MFSLILPVQKRIEHQKQEAYWD